MISTLVSIYDSKDLFVKELQVLLAQRLLAITDDNFEKVEKEVSERACAWNQCLPRCLAAAEHRDFEDPIR